MTEAREHPDDRASDQPRGTAPPTDSPPDTERPDLPRGDEQPQTPTEGPGILANPDQPSPNESGLLSDPDQPTVAPGTGPLANPEDHPASGPRQSDAHSDVGDRASLDRSQAASSKETGGPAEADQSPAGQTLAEGLAAQQPSAGEMPQAVQDAFAKLEQAAKEHPLAAINEFGNLISTVAKETFDNLGGGEGEAWEQQVAAIVGSDGFGTSALPEAAEAGAAIGGEIGETVLEVAGEGGQAAGEFLGGVVAAFGEMVEKSADAWEALGNGEFGEAAALWGEGVVDALDEVTGGVEDAAKAAISMAGEVVEGAGEIAREIGEGAAEIIQGAANDIADMGSDLMDDLLGPYLDR